ncbi:MAG: hypothetical protein QXV76_04975 [Candidatus Bathyarchaeia archaeon]
MALRDLRLPLIAKGFLKVTRDKNHFTLEEISEYTRIPVDDIPILLESLYEITELDSLDDIDSSRFRVFLFLARYSQSLEDTASLLKWREFELFTSMILDSLGFDTFSNYRFKSLGRRWEIDVLGFRKPIIVAVDCKHMKRGYRSILSEAIDRHRARVEALALIVRHSFRRIIDGWDSIKLIPVIVTLRRSGYTIVEGFPIVHISALNDFLDSALPIMVLDGGLRILEV